ncbi:MAG: S10 family peptidase [Spirochaetales bacterium]
MSEEKQRYQVPKGAQSAHSIKIDGREIAYAADAGWLVVRDREKPVAELFHVYYRSADTDADPDAAKNRPLTFVFNGGPGAASAYLHVGAIGPRRVVFAQDATPPAPPVSLTNNEESWLSFTDLVFVDPVGTGFSRAIKEDEGEEKEETKEPGEKQFWKIQKDLSTLGEFITRFLSDRKRWESPIFVAGESYGGFRAAKLTRLLQERYGVGLNGAVLISPALEFALLDASDYDVLPWVDIVPSLVAAAAHHGRSSLKADASRDEILTEAERFATERLPELLIKGDTMSDSKRDQVLATMSKLTGLTKDVIELTGGRVDAHRFSRELLRDQGVVCGLYDATITATDPFPDRNSFEGADPTLRSIERIFAAGINAQLRDRLGLETDREYHLLSMEVNQGWQVDMERHALESQIGATDDLRYGMSLNPYLKVRITHGIYDLVTPYFSSNRIASLMKSSPTARENLSLKHYAGGHMFYAWDESRKAFAADMRAFYEAAVPAK